MKRGTKAELLRRKAELILEVAPDEKTRSYLRTLLSFAFEYERASAGIIPAEAFRLGDELLQGIVEAFPETIRARIESEIVRKFGRLRLGKPPKSAEGVVERVLRRGVIPDDDAASIVQEVLADTSNVDVLGLEVYQRLGALLDTYRCDVVRRVTK